MNKIGKAFKALWWILRKPVLLNRVLTDEDTWRSYVKKRYQLPDGLPVVEMDQLIGSGTIALGPMTFLDGGSLPTDLMLLAGLAEQIDSCSYFEIGTWRGESVATVSPSTLFLQLPRTSAPMFRRCVPATFRRLPACSHSWPVREQSTDRYRCCHR